MESLNKIIIPNGIEAVIADYKEQVIQEYRDNSLIEALPPILSKYEVMDKLAVYPYFNEKERELEPQYRVHLVQRLFQYFQPLNIHIDLENRLSRIIRQGYLLRNPLKPEFARSMNVGYEMILSEDINLCSSDNLNANAYGFSLVGASGIGKTSSILRVLNTLPQIITHSEYKNRKLNMYQLVYLKMDCPFDGSIRGLCLNFFYNVDLKLGTNYHKKYSNSRISANALLPIMSQIARNCFLGCLIIDEIQNLSLAKSGGAEKMLNFFCTLVNEIQIPVILIGTNKAMSVIQADFRQARRGSGSQGDMIFERMKKDENWNLLVEGMWEYQWTKKVTPLTQELSDVLYEESQGITSVAKTIYAISQIKAISSGKEEVTDKIIKHVAKENLQLVRPMLEALKSGNIIKIAKYEDICSINVEGFINKEVNNISLNNRIKELQDIKKKKIEQSSANIKEEAILKLLELDVEPNKAKKCVDTIVETMGENIEIKELVREAFKLTLEKQSHEVIEAKKRKEIEIKNDKDLRYIVNEGKKNGLTAHEALKSKGYIKDINSDFLKVG